MRSPSQAGTAPDQGAAASAPPRPLQNTALLTAASLAAKTCSFLLFLVATRRLGKTGYGDYTTVIAFVGLFGVATDLGLTTLAVRDVARDRTQLPRYAGNVLVLRVVLSLVVAVLCIGASLVLPHYSPTVRAGIVLWALALVPISVVGSAGIVFQGIERMAPLSALTTATAALTALLGIAILLMGGGVVALLAVAASVNVAVAAAALVLAGRIVPLRSRTERPWTELRWWPELMRTALPFAALALLNVLYSNADQVIVYSIKGHGDAGLYGVAYRFVTTFLVVLISPFNAAALPAFNRIAAGSRSALEQLVLSGLRLTLVVGVPVAVAGTLYAREILRLVGGRTEYLAAAPALQWLAWSFPCFTVLAILYNALYAVQRANTIAAIFGVTLIFNVGLNLLLVPHYAYFASAALTTLSEALNVILAGWAVWRYLINPAGVWATALRVAAAAGAMAAAIILVRPLLAPAGLVVGGAIGLCLGAVVYLATVHLLGALGPRERAILARLPLAGRYACLL